MKRINGFDILFFVLTVALILTVASHLRDGGTEINRASAVLMIEIEHRPSEAPMPHIHDKVELYSFEAEIVGVSENRLLILADGCITERGFLIGGAKYLFPNQPLFLRTSDGFLKARIEATLSHVQAAEQRGYRRLFSTLRGAFFVVKQYLP